MALKGMGVRHLQAILLYFCLVTNFIQQGNAGIANVIMTEEVDGKVLFEVEHWVKGQIYSAFFYIYPLTTILSGYLGTVINNKFYLLFNGLYGTTASYLSPVIIKNYGWKAFFAVRITQGLTQGMVMPQIYGQLSRWIPSEEIIYIGPITLSGMFAGTCFINTIGGFLGTSIGGWESIFYFSGHCSLVWCFAFMGFGAQDPESCWYISAEERAYITLSLATRVRFKFYRRVPWQAITTNLPPYAIIISHAAHNWSFQTIIKMVPLVMHKNFKLSMPDTGLMTGGPFLLLVFAIFPFSFLANFLLTKRIINVETLRFTANSIGQYGMGIFLFFMSFCEIASTSVLFYSVGLVLASCQLMGVYMNPFDLAPNMVCFLFGWTAGVAHIFSIIGPYVSTLIYESYDEQISWSCVIFVCACNNFLGNLLFIMFGSVEVQPYNIIHD